MKKILLLWYILFSTTTLAQTVKRSKVVSKGTITGMAYHPNVGMAITHGDGYVGFPALNGQVVDKQTGNPLSVDFPLLEKFQDAVSDDNGGWYITQGSEFTKVDEYTFPPSKYTYILHVKADNSIDTTFRVKSNINSVNFNSIDKIKKYNNTIYAWCGVYVNNQNQFQLLGFDSTTGNLIWDSKTLIQGNTNTLNWQIAQNRLYINGVFNKINDIPNTAKKAICYDLRNNTLTNWNPTSSLALDGDNISDMALSGSKVIFSTEYTYRIIAVDSTTGTNKLWDVTHPNVNATKIAATANNVFVLSQNRDNEAMENFSKIVKISATDGTLDNTWTINTNLGTRMYSLFVDTNFLYATCDIDVTVLNTKNSALIKINTNNRSVEEWRPFNDPITNGASKPASIGVIGESLKLAFDNSNVFIGGNYGLLKQNGKAGIALIRPESESVIDWKPNVKQFSGNSPSFENDSTLWVWGDIVDLTNTVFRRQLVAFDIRTGDMIHHFPVQIQANEIIKKISVTEGKIIVSVNSSSFSAGTDGYLQAYNSTTGVKESWITGSIINNFQVVDSLLYFCGGAVNLGVQTKQNLGCINLKTNQFVAWNVEFPPGTDLNTTGAYRDFVITGRKVIIAYGLTNNPKSYFEFDRFTGKLLSTFGTDTERSNFITAGEKYFFLASNNGGDNTAKCGSAATTFYYDLEYKKFSSDCFLKKRNTSQRGISINQQFFLAQNYLYLNLSWGGNDRPIGAEQSSFLRTSFPKGFFKDEINPAFFPKIGGNSGFVTVNFYGYSFVEGCKIRLKKVGQSDIIVPDSLVSYPEQFTMIVKLNLRGRAIGDWDIEVTLSNGEKSVFIRGFRIIDPNNENLRIVTEIIPPRALRIGGTTKMSFIVTNTSNVDGLGIPLYIYLTKGLEIVSKTFVLDSGGRIVKGDSVLKIAIDSIGNSKFDGNCYMFFIPKIISKEILTFEIKVKAVSRGIDGFKFGILAGQSLLKINFSNPDISSLMPQKTLSEEKVTLASCMRSTLECLLEVVLSEKCINLLSYIPRLAQNVYFNVAKNDPFSYIELYKGVIDIGFTYGDIVKCSGGIVSKKLKQLYNVLTNTWTGYECLLGIYGDCNANRNTEKFVEIPLIASFDPNDKLGPVGVKSQRYVNGVDPFTYKIRFENYATATAAAQYVRVLDTLDRSKFNFDTFQFGHFNVADTNFYASPGKKHHLVDWDLRPVKDLILRMEAKFIDSTGILDATYTALDPATMEWTEDPILGFLPPNVNAPEGEGSLTFSIFPKDSLATGTTISNKAYIYFDYNPVIPTPPWVNTIDATLPSSSMTALPVISRDTTLSISWQGNDAESGPKLYDVMVSVNDQPYRPVLLATKLKTFNFIGKVDSTYKFYTVAYDSVYNKEPVPITFGTQTVIRQFTVIQSITSGSWNNPSTWDCNCVPIITDNVIIKSGHKVIATAEMDGVCKKLLVEQGAIFEGNGKFKADSRE